jgi:hypothetical protein
MLVNRIQARFLWIAALLFSSLACRAATRLIIPDTPTPLPTATATPTFTPTLPPTFTPTVVFEAVCPALLADIVEAGIAEGVVQVDSSDQNSTKEPDDVYLVIYEIVDGEIGPRHLESVPDDLKDEQEDRATHEAIWSYFAALIPAEERDFVSEFVIFTDGNGNHLAAVGQNFFEPNEWSLQVDILDSENYYELTYTLLHEQGHLLTLNSEQVSPSQAVFDNPDDDVIYQSEVSACPQYFTGEGCSHPDSYVNEFFDRFWPYIYEEWQQIDEEKDEETRYNLLDDFYQVYQDQFLTDYAPTSPAEDIAESWAFFILSPKPELDSIAHEKILFFYEYPELVELRTQILTQLCAQFPQ